MSNYPPGVTGFEPEIAGYPDPVTGRMNVACIDGGTDENPCTFTGDVDTEITVDDYPDPYDVQGTATWECPNCGAEHEDRVDLPSRDPDEERDD